MALLAYDEFERPKEAMTFYPTEEEFEDPIAYIRKIKPQAEKFGICKIKPPSKWTAPFTVDPNKLKFRPRIQKLNQLDAVTRLKLTFTDRVINYWQLLGTELIIPVLSSKPLDLYNLYQFVHSDEFVKSDDDEDTKWKNVSKRMGFVGCHKTELKSFYDEYLAPFHQWKVQYLDKELTSVPDECSNSRAMKRVTKRQMGGRGVVVSQSKKQKDKVIRARPRVKDKNCQICGKRSYKDSVVECKGCLGLYHPYCFDVQKNEDKKINRRSPKPPPLNTKVWHCPDCLFDKLRPESSLESGFEESEEEYTLQGFGKMADKFKTDHFNQPASRVPLETVEKEFWRLVSSINEDVEVKYGADLDAREHLKQCSSSTLGKDKCSRSRGPWNFSELPKLNGSAFGHFNTNISGMTSPWLYVGMCFSTFCWHNEDHWSYSISYLHRGDVKTWYGVPGSKAEEFENAMKSVAPELFAQTPNLLHQLVTIMSPSVLQKKKVPVYRMDQKPGEFIVTFPRAYHAGFNQGFNFAEAVNFAPADWVPVGRECVENYSQFKRPCVFSHDELICSMAQEPEKMDWLIASAANQDMRKLYKSEREFRSKVFMAGVRRSRKLLFEEEFDDHRQCHVCKTTLFMSAVSCECYELKSKASRRMVCPKHFDQLGCDKCRKNPAGYVLLYRHTLDDLLALGHPLKDKAEKFDTWKSQTLMVLKNHKSQPTLHQLDILLKQAKDRNFPRTTLLDDAEGIYADLLNEKERKPRIVKRSRADCDSDNDESRQDRPMPVLVREATLKLELESSQSQSKVENSNLATDTISSSDFKRVKLTSKSRQSTKSISNSRSTSVSSRKTKSASAPLKMESQEDEVSSTTTTTTAEATATEQSTSPSCDSNSKSSSISDLVASFTTISTSTSIPSQNSTSSSTTLDLGSQSPAGSSMSAPASTSSVVIKPGKLKWEMAVSPQLSPPTSEDLPSSYKRGKFEWTGFFV